MFERHGLLNRSVEFLPDDEALAERAANRQSLTRPEIAVLFSYCKLWLYDDILHSNLPDDRHLAEDVTRYFPTPLQKTYKKRIANHRLRRELIATSIVNSLINRVSGTFVTEIAEKTGMPAVDIARAYIISRDVFALREVWEQIEALDNKVPASVQITLHQAMQTLTQRGALWFLRNGGSPIDITVNISSFGGPVAALADMIETVLPQEMNDRILYRVGRYTEDGVPEPLARRVAYAIVMPSACDIVRLAAARGISIEDVARLYFNVGEHLGFGWLRYQAEKLRAATYWEKLAAAAVIEEFYAHQRDVTHSILETAGSAVDGAFNAWADTRRASVERSCALLSELETAGTVDHSMLTVASGQLRSLVER
jgi:glutamate dehydrogenase